MPFSLLTLHFCLYCFYPNISLGLLCSLRLATDYNDDGDHFGRENDRIT